jgi:2-keto-3-deoxy-L-rhamnonate aldolase RhmA
MADVVDPSADSSATSHELDTEPIWAGVGAFAEMEAVNIQTVLAAAGIDAIVSGPSQLPSDQFEVLVTHDKADQARQVLAEAIASGPAAAEEAERLTELP